MKIRTDFVTNSSSTGYILIKIRMENDNYISLTETYDTGFGGYFWNSKLNYDTVFSKVKTGDDILKFLLEKVPFIQNNENFESFSQYLSEAHSTNEIDYIHLTEKTNFDDGDNKSFSYDYVFPHFREDFFISPNKFQFSYFTECCYTGKFEHFTGKQFEKYCNENLWSAMTLDSYLFDLESIEKNDLPLLIVVGDETVKTMRQNKLPALIVEALNYKKRYNLINWEFITETDFITLGKYKFPWSSAQIKSIRGQNVAVLEQSNSESFSPDIIQHIVKCGGFPTNQVSKRTKYAVINTSDKKTATAIKYNSYFSKNRIPVFAAEDFYSATKIMEEEKKIPHVYFDGILFCLANLSREERAKANGIIKILGGKVVHSLEANKDTRYVVYNKGSLYPDLFFKAMELESEGKDIEAIEYLDFLKAVELYYPETTNSLKEKSNFNQNTNTRSFIESDTLAQQVQSSIIIPYGVTKIDETMISDRKDIKSVVIPDSVLEIGNGTFKECPNLKSVLLSRNLAIIGDSAFEGCKSLEDITIPDGVTTIGKSAFSKCINITEMNIPKSVNSIGAYAFYRCERLRKVRIEDGVTEIGFGVFLYCSRLSEITIPDSVTTIGPCAFSDCEQLTQIVLPKDLNIIERNLFDNCTYLEEITIPTNVVKVGRKAFYNCRFLKELNLPNHIEVIEPGAFMRSGLIKLTIPPLVTSLPSKVSYQSSISYEGVFEYCDNLLEVSIPDSIVEIEKDTFYGCTKIRHINITEEHQCLEENFFGSDAFPNKLLVDEERHVLTCMTDSALEQYILKKKKWERLSAKLQAELVIKRLTSNSKKAFFKCITKETADSIGKEILNFLTSENSGKDFNAVTLFLDQYQENMNPKLCQDIYDIIKIKHN